MKSAKMPVAQLIRVATLVVCLLVLIDFIEAKHKKNNLHQRSRVKLPKLVGWSKFKKLFHKFYPSLKEELFRQRIYLKNVLRTFAQNIRYRRGKSSHYLAINNKTDWTTKETDRLYSYKSNKTSKQDTVTIDNDDLKDTSEVVNVTEPKQDVLTDVDESKQEVGTDVDEPKQDVITDVVNNPEESLPSILEEVSDAYSVDFLSGDQQTQDTFGDTRVYLDHRQSGCLSAPRAQGYCGACYIFASITIMEWFHCKQTGELVNFSEQHVLDCGSIFVNRNTYRNIEEGDLEGCRGGSIKGVAIFYANVGVDKLDNYPYLGRVSTCRYDKPDDGRYKRPNLLNLNILDVKREYWPKLLEESPIYIILNVPEDFRLYGGGVHEGGSCGLTRNRFHAMVLVGHGIEDGREYWVVRNSWGQAWGELGYFRLAKDANEECFDQVYEMSFDFTTAS